MFKNTSRFAPMLEDHNRQMVAMNTTLTIFTTFTEEQLAQPGCHLNHLSNIETKQFDPVTLLKKYHYTDEQIKWMKLWHKVGHKKDVNGKRPEKRVAYHHYVTRLADIWRVLLAREYHMAYADLDMMYLSPHKEVYLKQPNVAVPVWAEEKGAFEIQNSGFCFNSAQLDVLIRKQQLLINSKGPQQALVEQYTVYTSMGPVLFQKSIQEMMYHGPIRLYLTSCDDDTDVKRIVTKQKQYQFVWIHLDSRFRGGHMSNLREIHIELREKCIPPKLEQIFPPRTVTTTTFSGQDVEQL